MKWLQANPVGMVLAGIAGFLLLIALVMAVVWTLPVSVEPDENANADLSGPYTVAMADKLEDLREYEIINQRPVFNESRLPVIIDETGEGDLLEESIDSEIAVKDAPDVKLTGIIITPGMKLASFTPNGANVEGIVAYEGDALTGEYLGWQISEVGARNVVLKSLDGQTLKLELEVHDAKIQEPPKPAPPRKAVAQTAAEPGAAPDQQPAENAAAEGEDTGDDEPLSRAEQIRQRIAERREELRREQEAQKEQQTERSGRSSRLPNNSTYQNAIRARINNNASNQSSDEDKDG